MGRQGTLKFLEDVVVAISEGESLEGLQGWARSSVSSKAGSTFRDFGEECQSTSDICASEYPFSFAQVAQPARGEWQDQCNTAICCSSPPLTLTPKEKLHRAPFLSLPSGCEITSGSP